jgi:hypothetical protein
LTVSRQRLASRRHLCQSHSARREVGRPPGALPSKFEMIVNLKTAKALDLAVLAAILLRADEVIE